MSHTGSLVLRVRLAVDNESLDWTRQTLQSPVLPSRVANRECNPPQVKEPHLLVLLFFLRLSKPSLCIVA